MQTAMARRESWSPSTADEDPSADIAPKIDGADHVSVPVLPTCTGASIVAETGSTIVFHDLCYTINQSKKEGPKTILKHVSGMFVPGVNAIMGPTGGGKTTLLDCIAGRKNPKGVSGIILIDGKLQPMNFRLHSGYVEQEDMIMGTLSVKENLYFSANLRLSSNVKTCAKTAKVEKIMQELGITHVANSKIGNDFTRGVSGGEKKRTAIGMELVTSPSVLFLDEPTTGLDAHTAGSVMELLHKLSQEGCTIICSIHQPRFAIYKLFDNLTLVCKGRMVFHGPASETLDYFTPLGFVCEMHDNPADFFLDSLSSGRGPDGFPLDEGKITTTDERNDQVSLAFNSAYKASRWYQSVQVRMQPWMDEVERLQKLSPAALAREVDYEENYKSSFCTQFCTVSKRAIVNSIRTPQSSFGPVVIMLILAVINGTLYFQVPDTVDVGIQNRIGAFFFIVMNQIFSNMSALELFNKERPLFLHEHNSGYYRVSSYFLAKVICDLLPFRVLPAIFFSLIAYFMIGFRDGIDHFFIFVVTLIVLANCGVSVIFFWSAATKHFALANICTGLTFVTMLIFGGFFVQLDSIASWIRWVKYFSFLRYGLNALSVNELKDRTLLVKGADNVTRPDPNAGNNALDQFAIPYRDDMDFLTNYLAMLGLLFGFLTLAYISLRRINKFK